MSAHRRRRCFQIAVRAGKDNRDLALNWQRLVPRLLENFHQPRPAIELRLGGLVEIAPELRERRKLPDCASSRRSEPATCRMALTCAEPPTRDTELPTLIAGRTP